MFSYTTQSGIRRHLWQEFWNYFPTAVERDGRSQCTGLLLQFLDLREPKSVFIRPEPGSYGIEPDVFAEFPQIGRLPQEVIPAFTLPEPAALTGEGIYVVGGPLLDGTAEFQQTVAGDGLQEGHGRGSA